MGHSLVMTDVKRGKSRGHRYDLITNNTGWDLSKSSLVNPAGIYSRDYFTELVNSARRMGAEFIAAYQHWGV